MSLDIYFREDVINRLRSINSASASTAEMTDDPIVQAHRRGYMQALTAVALSFGLRREDLEAEAKQVRR